MARIDEIIQSDLEKAPQNLKDLLQTRDSGFRLVSYLEQSVEVETIATSIENQKIWQAFGLHLFRDTRYQESIELFFTLYKKMSKWQLQSDNWVHKGMPLAWMSDVFLQLGYYSLAKRFGLLCLVEDSIRDISKNRSTLNIENGGIYFRLRYKFAMNHNEIIRYTNKYSETFEKLETEGDQHRFFPEFVLLENDRDWQVDYPNLAEYSYYMVNSEYLSFLKNGMNDGTGTSLESLAEYLMFCMPGCRTEKRVPQFGNTTDYDIVCSIDGPVTDFRSELGRYIICECKDWKNPVNFSTLSKFSRVLTSTKTKFGILFSQKGITGKNTEKYATREHKKVFQDSNIIIAVIDENDIDQIIAGKNLISLLRRKYEYVRLDKNQE